MTAKNSTNTYCQEVTTSCLIFWFGLDHALTGSSPQSLHYSFRMTQALKGFSWQLHGHVFLPFLNGRKFAVINCIAKLPSASATRPRYCPYCCKGDQIKESDWCLYPPIKYHQPMWGETGSWKEASYCQIVRLLGMYQNYHWFCINVLQKGQNG